MPTLFQQYEYAKLANAAYIDFSTIDHTDGVRVAEKANDQELIPLALAQQMFNAASDEARGQPVWSVLGAPHHNDAVGFHAALFGRGTEKVLAIAGTEPGVSGQLDRDLLLADLVEIGSYGVVVQQAVSMINYILRLTQPAGTPGVRQLSLYRGLPPIGPEFDPEQVIPDPGVTGNYFWIEGRNDGTGLGGIVAGDSVRVTGHSMGGHLAALALRLFPNLFVDAYAYNAPGFDPTTSAKLTDEFVALFAPYLPATPAASFAAIDARLHTYESEDLAPGDDVSIVSSALITGAAPKAETFITTEQNSHGIGQIVDSLALQTLFARMNPGFNDAQARALFGAASPDTANSQERLLEALHKLLLLATPLGQLPEVRAGGLPLFSSDGD